MIERYFLSISVLLLVASLVLKQELLMLMAFLVFFTFFSAQLWSRNSLKKFIYERNIKENRAFCGDLVPLTVKVINRKLLPLLWVRVEDELPHGLTLLDEELHASEKPNKKNILSHFSLAPYHSVQRQYKVQCLKRGIYQFGPAVITASDPFGINRNKMTVEASEHLIVYPRVYPLEKYAINANQLFGDIRVKKHLFQDPAFPLGVREYRYGDNPRHINWRATARMRELQTKKFDHNVTLQLSLFVDVRTIERPYWGTCRETIEKVIAVAASIGCDALKRGYSVSLCANELISFYSRFAFIKVQSSSHDSQVKKILEALAAVRAIEALPLYRMINLEQKTMPPGATVVAITAISDQLLESYLYKLKRLGQRVVLIIVGSKPTINNLAKQGITMIRVEEESIDVEAAEGSIAFN